MGSIKRIVDTSFWTDVKVADVMTPEDKYFMLYLLTNPHTTQLGIYELSLTQAAMELGYSKDSVRALLERFDTKYGIIKYSASTGEVAIKNFLRHSIVKGGKPVMDCLLKEEQAVQDHKLLGFIYNHLSKYESKLNTTVKEYVHHLHTLLNENENVNDNDNDNERIVPRIVNESSKTDVEVITKNTVPPPVETVEQYCRERNNGINAEHFCDYYAARGWKLNNGKKMVDWQAAVRTWESNDKKRKNERKEGGIDWENV